MKLGHAVDKAGRQLSWDASGRYLATGGGPSATVWDCSGTGPEGTEPALLGDSIESLISSLSFHPSGPILATADVSGRLRIWRMAGPRGDRLASILLDDEITATAWHPSGQLLAATTATGRVIVLNADMVP